MYSTPGYRRAPEPWRRAGFTLIELLVALTISGILATVMIQLLQGNSRFVAMQSAREEVQQNGRASLDLIASDLRSASPAAVREIRPNSVRFFLPRAWGVLCNAVSADSTTAFVLFPAGGFPADFSRAAHWGIGVEQTPDSVIANGRYRFVREPRQVTAGSRCDAIQPRSGNASRFFTTGFAVSGSLVDAAVLGTSGVIRPGSQVMVFEEVAYDVSVSADGPPGFWIRRMSGYLDSRRNMQPMAGPLPRDTSLVFTYLQEDGVTAATAPEQVRHIRIWLETRSRANRRRDGRVVPAQVDTFAADVTLRNR